MSTALWIREPQAEETRTSKRVLNELTPEGGWNGPAQRVGWKRPRRAVILSGGNIDLARFAQLAG